MNSRFIVIPNRDANKWVAGAKTLIKATQKAKNVSDEVKRVPLNHLIWIIGDANFLLKEKKYKNLSCGETDVEVSVKKNFVKPTSKFKMDGLATKYCSSAARKLLEKHKGKGCRRDHVFERNKIIKLLLKKDPDVLRSIQQFATVCLITKKEHAGLNKIKNLDGWDRYIEYAKGKAKFKIWDRETGKEVLLTDLSRSQI